MEIRIESDTMTVSNVPDGLGSVARLVLSTVCFRRYTFVSYLGLFPKKKMLAAAPTYGELQCSNFSQEQFCSFTTFCALFAQPLQTATQSHLMCVHAY